MKRVIILLLCVLIWSLAIRWWIPPIQTIVDYSYWDGFISDYRFFYYAFENVWQKSDPNLLYHCVHLRDSLAPILPNIPEHGCYLYPPQFAVLLSWLGAFPYKVSDQIWNIGSFALFIGGLGFIVPLAIKKRRWEIYLFLLGVGLLANPALVDTFYNNSNRFIFFFICLSLYLFYHRRSGALAGIPLGLAIVFKITPAIIFIFLLIKGRVDFVISTLVTMLVSTFISIYFIGWGVHWNYITRDFWGFSDTLVTKFVAPANSSLKGTIGLLLPDVNAKLFFYVYVVFIFAFLVWFLLKKADEKQEIMLLSLTPLLFSPHLEIHHMVLGVIPLLIWLGTAIENNYLGWKYVLFVPSLYLIAIKPLGVEYFILLMLLLCLGSMGTVGNH